MTPRLSPRFSMMISFFLATSAWADQPRQVQKQLPPFGQRAQGTQVQQQLSPQQQTAQESPRLQSLGLVGMTTGYIEGVGTIIVKLDKANSGTISVDASRWVSRSTLGGNWAYVREQAESQAQQSRFWIHENYRWIGPRTSIKLVLEGPLLVGSASVASFELAMPEVEVGMGAELLIAGQGNYELHALVDWHEVVVQNSEVKLNVGESYRTGKHSGIYCAKAYPSAGGQCQQQQQTQPPPVEIWHSLCQGKSTQVGDVTVSCE